MRRELGNVGSWMPAEQRQLFETEGVINSVQCSQEAKTENCQSELDGRTSLARGRFDEVVKSEATLSQLIRERSGFPRRTPTLPVSSPLPI